MFAEQSTTDPRHPRYGQATLTLRVPPSAFGPTLDAAGRLGKRARPAAQRGGRHHPGDRRRQPGRAASSAASTGSGCCSARRRRSARSCRSSPSCPAARPTSSRSRRSRKARGPDRPGHHRGHPGRRRPDAGAGQGRRPGPRLPGRPARRLGALVGVVAGRAHRAGRAAAVRPRGRAARRPGVPRPARPGARRGHRRRPPPTPSRSRRRSAGRRRLVHQVDEPGQHVGVGLGEDAVAEVEDVARRGPAGGQDRRGSARPRRPTARRASAGSRLPCSAWSGPTRRAASSSGTRQSTPTTSAPASPISAEQLAGADAEVDARHAELGRRAPSTCGGVRHARSAR